MPSLPFIPVITEIRATEAGRIPGLEAVISYWTEGARSADEWYAEISGAWGTAGFAMCRGEETLGFAVYGPPEYLSRASRYPLEPLGRDAALLAYLEGDARTRRHLLARVMRDLRLRGFGGVEAIASDFGRPGHIPTRFLLESGWKPVRRSYRAGLAYTLLRADFGSVLEVGERARGLVGRVRLPGVLGAPAPATLASGGPRVRMQTAKPRPRRG